MSQDPTPPGPTRSASSSPTSNTASERGVDGGAAEDIVAQVESGARKPAGLTGRIIVGVCLAWALFQLWYASPLPFVLGFGIFNGTEARSIHLAFALFLAYTAYPAFKWSPRGHIPIQDWIFALTGAFCAAYLVLFNDALAQRPGAPTTMDVTVGTVGLLLLLEATRRALGPPLLVVALVFLGYTFGGAYMPDMIAHQGASLNKAMSHYWITTEGVFGVALGVSTSMVFLFVLFGAFLERAGAGMYFIRVAFAFMGHLRGGPAKAAVVSSAMTGLISGSSIANVVTTGTFTIPLMKKVGFPGTKAGAVEVASSTNGQLTPPIMGAAAFLMVEYVGISYIEVMKHAIVPAVISYIALVYIVHLEALKAGMKGLPRIHVRPWHQAAIGFLGSFLLVSGLGAIVYFTLGWLKPVAGDATPWIAAVALLLAHVGLVRLVTTVPPPAGDRRHRRTAGTARDRALRPALPAAGGGAGLVPDDRAPVAGPVGLLGRHHDDDKRHHPAPAGGLFPGSRASPRGRSRPPGLRRPVQRHGHGGAQHDRHRRRHGGGPASSWAP